MQLHDVTVSTIALNIFWRLLELLWKINSINYIFKQFKSNLQNTNQKKKVSVAAFEKCFLISTSPSIFVFYIHLGRNKTFSKILFHWYGTYLISWFQVQVEVDLGNL